MYKAGTLHASPGQASLPELGWRQVAVAALGGVFITGPSTEEADSRPPR